MAMPGDWTIEVLPFQSRGELRSWLEQQAPDHSLTQLLKSTGEQSCEFWVARRGRAWLAIAAVEWLPGRTASLISPWSTGQSAARGLLNAIATAARQRECVLVQALTELDVGADAELLKSARFEQIADLVYLVSLSAAFPDALPRSELSYEPYAVSQQQRLMAIVERSYQGTLDCPSLNGLRRVEDVIAGYRSPDNADADLWSIACADGEDVGCLLLRVHDVQANLEIVYVGVAPEYRGRGYGLEMIRRAQWTARLRRLSRAVLAVDAANEPALRLYASSGFTAWDRRTVWVRLLDRGE